MLFCWLIWRRRRLKAEVDGRWFAGGFPCDFWSLPSVSVAHLQHHVPNATLLNWLWVMWACREIRVFGVIFLPQKLWSQNFFWQISCDTHEIVLWKISIVESVWELGWCWCWVARGCLASPPLLTKVQRWKTTIIIQIIQSKRLSIIILKFKQ